MTLERIRALERRVLKRRRRGKAVRLVLMSAGLAACLYALAGLAPLYGQWARDNRYESRRMCAIDTPAYLVLSVSYDGDEPPRNVRVVHDATGRVLYGTDVSSEPGLVTITRDMGPDLPSGTWSVEMIPGTSRRISCQADIYPSYRYIDGHAEACVRDGLTWLVLSARYDRCLDGRAVSVSVSAKGPDGQAVLYDVQADGTLRETALCLDILAEAAGTSLSGMTSVEVSMSAPYQPPEGADDPVGNASFSLSIPIGEIGPCAHGGHDSAATEDYAARTADRR